MKNILGKEMSREELNAYRWIKKHLILKGKGKGKFTALELLLKERGSYEDTFDR